MQRLLSAKDPSNSVGQDKTGGREKRAKPNTEGVNRSLGTSMPEIQARNQGGVDEVAATSFGLLGRVSARKTKKGSAGRVVRPPCWGTGPVKQWRCVPNGRTIGTPWSIKKYKRVFGSQPTSSISRNCNWASTRMVNGIIDAITVCRPKGKVKGQGGGRDRVRV